MNDLMKLSNDDLIDKHRSICFGYMVELLPTDQLKEVEQELKRRLARLKRLEIEKHYCKCQSTMGLHDAASYISTPIHKE